ncbi:MAG: thioredoxin family protein [Candidatus Cyclobacteriaceae bacterium M3_2C_046]
MAATPSIMVELGTKAPQFALPDVVSGQELFLDQLKSPKATLIMFICNHCPYVLHIIDKVSDIAKNYQGKGVAFVAISSNDIQNYPQDDPELMKDFARDHHFTFPYLYDETQEVAKSYQAACTPDLYLFDGDLNLVYRGQFDDSRPKNDQPVTGRDLMAALDDVLAGREVNPQQLPSIGCNIKWKRV